MLVMIFVNDLAGVKGLPWWTYHMPRGVNGMTYVDVVFPAFLFLVGMSIPLAVNRRIEKDDSQVRLWAHIVARAVSLVVLGLLVANSGKLDPALAGISRSAWTTLGLLAAIALWHVEPKPAARPGLHRALRIAGLVGLVALFAVFRRTTPQGQPAWLDFGYWEILGLIGRAYLAACLLYVPLRNRRWAPPVLLAVLTALNVASRLGWTPWLRKLPYWAWPFGNGDLVSIAMAGIVASTVFLDTSFAPTFRRKAWWATAYTFVLAAAGWALLPFGVSKLKATPTWCLWCAALCVLLFLALYWLFDEKGRRRWAAPVRPAGENTLLTYLLPDVFYAAVGWSWLPVALKSGWPGTLRSFAFTAAMLGLAAVLTRWKVRMQL